MAASVYRNGLSGFDELFYSHKLSNKNKFNRIKFHIHEHKKFSKTFLCKLIFI